MVVTGIDQGSSSKAMFSSSAKSRSMKEDDAPESSRAEVVLPLMSSLISKQGDCGGWAVQEDEEAGTASVSQGLESLFAGHGKLGLVSRELLIVTRDREFKLG